MRILKIIGWVLLGILYFGYLEIFKNQIWGWALSLGLIGIYVFLMKRPFAESAWYVRLGTFALFVVMMIFAAVVSKPKEKCVKAVKVHKMEYTDEVKVNEGRIVGVYNEDKSVEVFTGIPYAKPPVGDLRWKEPQAPEAWDGVKVCDHFAPMAMQGRSNPIVSFGSSIVGYNELPLSFEDNFIEAMSEDCLYVNIWRPSGTKAGDKLPVLFYVHGGSLDSGQTYWEPYNGASLAKQGIVFVNIAYRVGVFGYMGDEELAAESENGTTGNYGLLDQIAALKWVNENIGAFGGDASNITIAGESAGSSSVNAMCCSPLTEGLFRRVIAESSGVCVKKPYHTFRSYEEALETGKKIKAEFNCSSIEELRKIPASVLVNTKVGNNEMTVDGYALVEEPYVSYLNGRNHEEAVLGGFNGNEAYIFMMFGKKATMADYSERLGKVAGTYGSELAEVWPAVDDEDAARKNIEMVGAAWFGYSHYVWSNMTSSEGKPTYLYFFNKDNKALGPWHAGEMEYFYGNIPGYNGFKKRFCLTLPGTYNESDYRLSEAMQKYYLNFVKTGNPNDDGSGKQSGLPVWETYNKSPERYMQFDSEMGMAENKYLKVFQVFDRVMESRF